MDALLFFFREVTRTARENKDNQERKFIFALGYLCFHALGAYREPGNVQRLQGCSCYFIERERTANLETYNVYRAVHVTSLKENVPRTWKRTTFTGLFQLLRGKTKNPIETHHI